MRNGGLDGCMARWTDSFMRDHKVTMSVDGQDGEAMPVTTGSHRGSPSRRSTSPSMLRRSMARWKPCREQPGTSFVDDVTRIVEGTNFDDVVSKLERCTAATANNKAVHFETSKTEAILFSKRSYRCSREIRVRGQMIRFVPQATRWLGIWLDSTLTLAENWRRRIGKTRQAEARLRRIVSKYGVPPAASRNLQSAIVQGTMLYAAEQTWEGQKGVEDEY